MADTSDAVLAFAADPTPDVALSGAIPWKYVNMVSHDFAPQADNVQSKVIRPDAAVQDVRRFSGGFAGTLSMELARDVELEDLMAAALRGAWASNVLKAGVAKSQLVFEEKVLEGASPFYNRYRGGVVGGFALEVGTDGLADIRFPVTGRKIDDATTAVATSTYSAAGSAPVLAGVDFTGLTLGGFTNTLDVESISIDMTNNLRSDRRLGSPDPRAIPYGKRNVNIEGTLYFEDNEALQKFKADPTVSGTFGFTAPGGTAGFDFYFGRLRIVSYGKPIPGENNTIMVTLGMMATYDATDGTDFKITRRV